MKKLFKALKFGQPDITEQLNKEIADAEQKLLVALFNEEYIKNEVAYNKARLEKARTTLNTFMVHGTISPSNTPAAISKMFSTDSISREQGRINIS
jgi:hypothetical protein